MLLTNVVFHILAFLLAKSAGDLCQSEQLAGSPSLNGTAVYFGDQEDANGTEMNTVTISCPRPGDPPEYTLCCYEAFDANASTASPGDTRVAITRCCPPDTPSNLFPFVSDKIALIIAVTVTSILTLLTVGIVFCCFSPKCPLYMACRVRYRQDDIIAYPSKDDETANLNEMPPEEQKGVKVYSPNAVKITKTEEY